MRGLGQIADLAAIARPQIGVVTGVGPVHLELLGTIENVARGQGRAAAGAAGGRHRDRAARRAAARAVPGRPRLRRGQLRRRGWRRRAAARVPAAGGAGQAEIALRGRTLTVPVNFTARHNALNLAAAAAAYDSARPAAGRAGAGRRRRRASRAGAARRSSCPAGGVLIADCYNANPTSMARRAAPPRRNRPPAGGGSPCSATWPSSGAGAGASTPRSGELRASWASTSWSPSAGVAAAYGGSWFATGRRRSPRRPACC